MQPTNCWMINHWWINLISIPNRLSGSYWIPTNGQTVVGTRDWDLPSLKALNHLPVISIDTREQERLRFTRCRSKVATLRVADYGLYKVPRAAAVERKSIPDLVMCCGTDRERFGHQLENMMGYACRRLVIIGDRSDIEQHRYRSNMNPRSVLATVSAFEVRYDCPVFWFSTPEAAALQIESWLSWVAYGINRDHDELSSGSEALELLTETCHQD